MATSVRLLDAHRTPIAMLTSKGTSGFSEIGARLLWLHLFLSYFFLQPSGRSKIVLLAPSHLGVRRGAQGAKDG